MLYFLYFRKNENLLIFKKNLFAMYDFGIKRMLAYLDDEYEIIRSDYSGTELLSEVVHCLDWLFPAWKTNAGLGESAPEFVLSILRLTEDTFNVGSQSEWLHHIYEEVLDVYSTSRELNLFVFKEKCNDKIMNMSDDEFLKTFGKEERDMTSMELSNAFESYQNELLNVEVNDFRF